MMNFQKYGLQVSRLETSNPIRRRSHRTEAWQFTMAILLVVFSLSCNQQLAKKDTTLATPLEETTAQRILGNPSYLAMAYGGYRAKTRDTQPTIAELKEDMKILAAMGVRIVRTYNMQLPQAPNLLEAIRQLKKEDSSFELSMEEKIHKAMVRARDYGVAQYHSTAAYIKSLGIDKPIHIGETGWASASNGFYGVNGTKATDEYKEGVYYSLMREWTNKNGIACFYFEAFDEIWKDANNAGGSENHFGLFTLDGQAKYALWDLVDKGVFKGLSRNGKTIGKTYGGSKEALLKEIKLPPTK